MQLWLHCAQGGSSYPYDLQRWAAAGWLWESPCRSALRPGPAVVLVLVLALLTLVLALLTLVLALVLRWCCAAVRAQGWAAG